MFQKTYWERKELDKRREPTHDVVKAYVLPKIELIAQKIQINSNNTLLDVGCGNGYFTYYLSKICKVTGIDSSKKMLQLNPIFNTILMDANNLNFPDNSFDIVFCHALLHHVENIDRVVSEMKRVSKKYVIVIEPNRNNPLILLFSLLVREERKSMSFSINYLRNILVNNGLKIIDFFSYGVIVPNKLPYYFLPFAKLFDFKNPIGVVNIIISEK
jgi:ubiquinone/menaquinone biosynthesis C-methylase UbiE